VRVLEPDLRDHAVDGDRPIRIELRGERMMRRRRHRGDDSHHARQQNSETSTFHDSPHFARG
jgi:hypothetical protein